MIPEVVVAGATSWGATLAIHIARKGIPVQLLTRGDDETEALVRAGSHPRVDAAFPESLEVSADASVLAAAPLLILAVPAQTMRHNTRRLARHIGHQTMVAHLAKGLERSTLQRMSVVIREELWAAHSAPIAAISGPNLAKEVAAGLPSTTVVGCADSSAARSLQDLLMAPTFRAYTNPDIIGVEFGGSLKNVIALGAGLVDGFKLGDNTKAGYVTRGLAEITRLGVAAGAEPLTFQGLSGLGDLVATCYSPLSRNRRVGEAIALGGTLEEILKEMGEVAEGVQTVPAALALSGQYGVEMPITEQANAILFEGRRPQEALSLLLEREPKAENW
ncbi:MAG: NAD(P)H-dependent glycerol-3-phosphate dehydrogenase [Dehalococcoidia bacterium]